MQWGPGAVARIDWGGGRALWLGHTWEVAAWKFAQLGSCHLGTFIGKLSLGKKPVKSTSTTATSVVLSVIYGMV